MFVVDLFELILLLIFNLDSTHQWHHIPPVVNWPLLVLFFQLFFGQIRLYRLCCLFLWLCWPLSQLCWRLVICWKIFMLWRLRISEFLLNWWTLNLYLRLFRRRPRFTLDMHPLVKINNCYVKFQVPIPCILWVSHDVVSDNRCPDHIDCSVFGDISIKEKIFLLLILIWIIFKDRLDQLRTLIFHHSCLIDRWALNWGRSHTTLYRLTCLCVLLHVLDLSFYLLLSNVVHTWLVSHCPLCSCDWEFQWILNQSLSGLLLQVPGALLLVFDEAIELLFLYLFKTSDGR